MMKLTIINKNSKLHFKKNKLAIGIDFGTTYSLVSIFLNNVTMISDELNRVLLPSVVNYTFKDPIVGWEAQNLAIQDPINTIISIKRLIGRSYEEIKKLYPNLPYRMTTNEQGVLSFITPHGLINTQQVSSQIFNLLKNRIISNFNHDIIGAVITVPAYFDDIQRQEIKKSAELAKLNVLRLLNEPTSAAIAYGLHLKKSGIIIVYDLGGGTFDVSVLKLNQGIFEVLATSGNSSLGGDDFDYLLAKYICKKFKIDKDFNDYFFQRKLLALSKSIKIKLSSVEQVSFKIDNILGDIKRSEFNSVIEPMILKTLVICQTALKDSAINLNEIKEIILVGGSTYIPRIREVVAHFFKKKPLYSINPDQVVVAGAAIQSDMLIGNNKENKIVLLDVVPLSLGVEVMGNIVEKIIFRNTTIPISQTKHFTTFKDGQTSMLIHVLQGEKNSVKDCRSLTRFILKGIPARPAKTIIIAVRFQVDVDGLLSVTAKVKSTKIKKSIVVHSTYGLNQAQIDKIIKDVEI